MYINVDLGEEIKPNLEIEKAVMPYIHACNIACGGHAGTVDTIRETIKIAQQYDVLCGAHPSYPDRINFGRKSINISLEDLRKSIFDQLLLYRSICDKLNEDIHHIKLHGALYNDSANNPILAKLVVEIIKDFDHKIILFAPPKSTLAKIAKEASLDLHIEIFGDRRYNDDLSLYSRSEKDALIVDKEKLHNHLQPILTQNSILTKSGLFHEVEMQTICMHSDHKGAIENIKYLATQILKN